MKPILAFAPESTTPPQRFFFDSIVADGGAAIPDFEKIAKERNRWMLNISMTIEIWRRGKLDETWKNRVAKISSTERAYAG
jgi:hypothetical protein